MTEYDDYLDSVLDPNGWIMRQSRAGTTSRIRECIERTERASEAARSKRGRSLVDVRCKECNARLASVHWSPLGLLYEATIEPRSWDLQTPPMWLVDYRLGMLPRSILDDVDALMTAAAEASRPVPVSPYDTLPRQPAMVLRDLVDLGPVPDADSVVPRLWVRCGDHQTRPDGTVGWSRALDVGFAVSVDRSHILSKARAARKHHAARRGVIVVYSSVHN